MNRRQRPIEPSRLGSQSTLSVPRHSGLRATLDGAHLSGDSCDPLRLHLFRGEDINASAVVPMLYNLLTLESTVEQGPSCSDPGMPGLPLVTRHVLQAQGPPSHVEEPAIHIHVSRDDSGVSYEWPGWRMETHLSLE